MPVDTDPNHQESYTTEAQPQHDRSRGVPQGRGKILYMPATAKQQRKHVAQNRIDNSPGTAKNSPANIANIQHRLHQAPKRPFTMKDRMYLMLTRFANWAGWLQPEDIDPKEVDQYIRLKTASAARNPNA